MNIQIKLMYVAGELPEDHPLYEENFNFKDQLVSLPGIMEVCGRCSGTGSHTNPSIDGNGLSDECLGDPDFMEDYMGGSYDVTCEECDGRNVVAVEDESQFSEMDKAIYKQHEEFVESQRQVDLESYYERRLGA